MIMAALALSGILGLLRQVLIAAAFGADRELDAFYAALRVPETLFVLVAGGALASAFIPVFAARLAEDDLAGAWKLASSTLSFMGAGAALLSLAAFLLADPLVAIFLSPGAPAADQALTADLMRIMLLTVVIFGVSGLMMGILNGYQHFLAPALAPSMYNLGLILGAVVLAPEGGLDLGVYGLAWGAVIGAGLHLLVQVPSLARLPGLRLWPVWDWRDSGAGEVFRLMLPRIVGLGAVQINFWLNAALTSSMAPGSLTALQTAFALMFTVLGILGQSIGTAVFPTLSRLAAEGDTKRFGQTLLPALQNVYFLSLPAGFGLAALAVPIVAVLFERGAWTRTDTQGAAWALALFGVGLAGHAILEVLARAFYALQDTWTPVKIGLATIAFNMALSLLIVGVYPDSAPFERGPFGALALAMSFATALESAALWWLLRRRITLADGPALRNLGLSTLAGLTMAGAVLLWQALGAGLPMLVLLLGGVLIGALTYGLAAWALGMEQAALIVARLRDRLGRPS
jgi:putative peptidoglycan lipid II flippase